MILYTFTLLMIIAGFFIWFAILYLYTKIKEAIFNKIKVGDIIFSYKSKNGKFFTRIPVFSIVIKVIDDEKHDNKVIITSQGEKYDFLDYFHNKFFVK